MGLESKKDFFISYTSADRRWAEWIAWHLEAQGYSVVIQAWDFRPGANFVLEMDKACREALRTLIVLSSNYLDSRYAQAEWAAAFRHDPTGKSHIVLPVRVQKCEVTGLLGPLVYIDLVDLDEATAQETLLAGVNQQRAKPTRAPGFPGGAPALPERSEPPRFPGALPPIWNVPHQRNPFFTGREEVLRQLHEALTAGRTAALTPPQAISGLGGIGKTQTAVEYAYRFAGDYQAVLWVKAEAREMLLSDVLTLADLLNLPEKEERDQIRMAAAVKGWLSHHGEWLLILDNADDLALAREFLPQTSRGHILLTTRAQAMGGLARRVEIEKMGLEEGTLFLLRRAGRLAPDASLESAPATDHAAAQELVRLVDGLPLALDQAGAYIEETQCGVAGYLTLYRARGVALFKERGGLRTDHPDPVTTTWSLSFQKVEQASPAAADLLRFCAFLAPDAIPEELLTKSASEPDPFLEQMARDPASVNAALKELLAYSLVHRDPETGTLSIHRLVQEVLKDQMDEQTQRQWAERTVRAVKQVFPHPKYSNWSDCRRYLPHAQVCVGLIERWELAFSEAAILLNDLGYYLWQRGAYTEVEPLHQRALAIHKKVLGAEHIETAISLAHLAFLYHIQGKYKQALPLYQRALSIREQVLGAEHPDTAQSLNNLASLYNKQGKYEQALPLYQRALSIREQVLGAEHPDTAQSLSSLAALYSNQGKYEQAEPLLKRALSIRKQVLGAEHPDTATSLNNLAGLYNKQGKYEQAEPLLKRALAIRKQVLGAEHPATATCLNNLATHYYNQGKYEQAEPLYQRALSIYEQVLGSDHPDTRRTRENYTDLLRRMEQRRR